MADVKISGLPAATTPLAGTEVLPIVQSSTTKKVSIADVTAGREISANGITDTSLTASSPVFTDANKKLTNSGTVPVSNGGTGGTTFTAGRLLFGNATSTLGSDAQIFWDNTNKRLGVGLTTPAEKLELSGGFFRMRSSLSISPDAAGNVNSLNFQSSGSTGAHAIIAGGNTSTNYLSFYTCNVAAPLERMRIFAAGGVSVGDTTDPGAGNLRVGTGNLVLGGAGKAVEFAGNGSVIWRVGAGSPEGAVTAPIGSLYTRTDGGANTTLYVKESGAGNTGWVAK